MPEDVRRSDDEPMDELTRMCERVMRSLEEEDPDDEVRAILMLTKSDGDGRNLGGMQLRGYGVEDEDGARALRELLHHAGAVAEAFGQRIAVLPMGQG